MRNEVGIATMTVGARHHARPGEHAARLGQGGPGGAGAAAPRQSVLHAAGLGLVPAHGAALAAAVPPGRDQAFRNAPRERAEQTELRIKARPASHEVRDAAREGRMITLWELGGRDGRRYSLFSWRTRMALAHKRLAFESKPVLHERQGGDRVLRRQDGADRQGR